MQRRARVPLTPRISVIAYPKPALRPTFSALSSAAGAYFSAGFALMSSADFGT